MKAIDKSRLDAYEMLSRDAERWLNQIQKIKGLIVKVESENMYSITTPVLRDVIGFNPRGKHDPENKK